MKLTKAQLKGQKALNELLNSKDTFTHEEIERIYNDFNEGYLGDVSTNSAYFTPLELAYDFALMVPTHGVVVDMCAGFGVLSYAALCRDTYEGQIKTLICLEREQKYIDIGKKLVQSNKNTNVVWIKGDMFDVGVWDEIEKVYGKVDCIMSNPPFGKVTKTEFDRSWLKYKGSEIDMAAIEISLLKAEYQSFILPQGSCTFRVSGRPYCEHVENKKVSKLKKESGYEFYMGWVSIDTKFEGYGGFKNTPVTVECLTLMDIEKSLE